MREGRWETAAAVKVLIIDPCLYHLANDEWDLIDIQQRDSSEGIIRTTQPVLYGQAVAICFEEIPNNRKYN